MQIIWLGVPRNPGQRFGEGGRGPRPPRPGGRQDRRREGGHGRRRCRPAASEALAPDAVPHLLEAATSEGMPARHHFVEDHGQRPDIIGFLDRAPGEDLGREVGQGAAGTPGAVSGGTYRRIRLDGPSTGKRNPETNPSGQGRALPLQHDKCLYRTLLQGPDRGTVKSHYHALTPPSVYFR